MDTGRARSNWIASVNTPSRKEVEAYAPGEDLGSGEMANAQRALDQAATTIAQVRQGDTIWISNNLAYIQRLDDGYSKQAPAGFVDRAVVVAVAKIRGVRILSSEV